MIIEFGLVPAWYLYSLVVAPGVKYILVNRAFTPREKTLRHTLADGTNVVVNAAPFENTDGELCIRFETWRGTDLKTYVLSDSEAKLLTESEAWKMARVAGHQVTAEGRDRMIALLDLLSEEIRTSRSRRAR